MHPFPKKLKKLKVAEWCLLSIAFFMPINAMLVTYSIIVLAIVWIIEGNWIGKFSHINEKVFFVMMIALYFIHILGLLYTTNIHSGLFDIQVKLSILVLPLLLGTSSYIKTINKQQILLSFVAGCLTASVLCIIRAIILYFKNGDTKIFYYSEFSLFMHPGYFAMYLCFAITILFHSYMQSQNRNNMLWALLGAWVLIFIVFLLSSKTGIIILLLIILIILGKLLRNKRYKHTLIGVVLISIHIALVCLVMKAPLNRFLGAQQSMNNTDKDSHESTAARKYVWIAAIDIIKIHPLLGVGTGDGKDELMKMYANRGLEGPYINKLNSHNEYLHIAVTLGLIGFLTLISCLFYPLFIAYIEKSFLIFMLLLIIMINFITEAMLERQAGVIFFAFFLSLLMFDRKKIIS